MLHIDELKKFGLSEKEARIYLALLELEVATAQEIAKAAKVNRSSAYVVLESLEEKGLVSVSAGSPKKEYVVAPPDKLIRLAEQAEQDRIEAREGIEAIMPDLKTLYSGSKIKPRVRIFEGEKGIIAMVEDTFAMKEKIMRTYTSGSAMHDFFRAHMPHYIGKREEAGITMRGIHPDDEANHELMKYGTKVDEHVLVPHEKFKFTCDLAIYDNTIGFISHREEFGILIESQEIAETMKGAFDLAFEAAKKLSK